VQYSFDVETAYGTVRLVEEWPLLYSVGFDEIDNQGKKHTDRKSEDGDFIFWPPVEIMAKNN